METKKIKEATKIKKSWSAPKIEVLGDAVDIIQNIFTAGPGDSEPGMSDLLASG